MSRGSYLQQKNHNSHMNSAILERVLAFVAPHECLFCSREGSVVCAWCLPEAYPVVPSRCYRCLALTDNYATCHACRRASRLKHVWVATEYTDASKALIHALKFERKRAAHQPAAQIMADILPYMPPETILTHIPTATSRVRQRGYDQAQLLAQWLSQEKQCTYQPLLARLGQTRQVGAKRAERISQLQDAFRVRTADKIKGASILLVDDVITTGATLEAAAHLLRKRGAKQVNAITFAQKHL
jgi:ComF family protein